MSTLSQAPEIRRDVTYATHDGEALQGDLYLPDGPGPFPVIVSVHGGGWQQGSRKTHRYWGDYLASRGYAVFAVSYRLSRPGRKTFPEAVQDVRAAVDHVRAEAAALRIDAARVALWGDSAGANLAALVALGGRESAFTPPGSMPGAADVKVLIGFYGVYDLVAQWQHDQIARPFDQITETFTGTRPTEDRRTFFDGSPLSYAVTANNAVACFLCWGMKDDVVDGETQSEIFQTALKQARFFVRSMAIPGAGHFFVSDPIEEPHSLTGLVAPKLLRFLADRL